MKKRIYWSLERGLEISTAKFQTLYFAHKTLGNHERFGTRENRGEGERQRERENMSLSKWPEEKPIFHIQLCEKAPLLPCGPLKEIVGNGTFPFYEENRLSTLQVKTELGKQRVWGRRGKDSLREQEGKAHPAMTDWGCGEGKTREKKYSQCQGQGSTKGQGRSSLQRRLTTHRVMMPTETCPLVLTDVVYLKTWFTALA